MYLPYLLLKRRYLAGVAFVAGFVAISFLPDMISALHGGHTGYVQDWIRPTIPAIAPGMTPGPTSSLSYWNDWVGQSSGHNQSLRGLVNRLASGPIFGLSPTMILVAVDGAFALMAAAILLISPRDKEYAAIDGAVLLIAVLVLSPMTSLSHYIIVLPVVILVAAAVINDRRMRVFGSVVLATSFHIDDRHVQRPDATVDRRVRLSVRFHYRGRDRATRRLGDDGGDLRRMTMPNVADAVWRAAIDELVQRQVLQRSGHWLHLPEHRITLSERELGLAQELHTAIAAGRFDPPWVRDLAVTVRASDDEVRRVLRKCVMRGKVH